MNQDTRVDLRENKEKMTVADICISGAFGIFALAVVWFASSLLIHMVR